MKKFLVRLWEGEPVYLFGFINTVLVSIGAFTGNQWVMGAAAVSTAAAAFVTRMQVTSAGENMFGG